MFSTIEQRGVFKAYTNAMSHVFIPTCEYVMTFYCMDNFVKCIFKCVCVYVSARVKIN